MSDYTEKLTKITRDIWKMRDESRDLSGLGEEAYIIYGDLDRLCVTAKEQLGRALSREALV